LNFSGDALLHAPQQAVWEALLDPAALAHCLPGCESLDEIGPDTYRAVVSLGIAAVKGKYTGQVQITDRNEPTSYRLVIEGQGSNGTVKGSGTMTLSSAADGTTVNWSADVQIGGPIASVGQRLFGGVTKLVAGDFFKCMDAQIAQRQSAS
jgi:carbon monoxide dehydrogenase subunit G